MKIVLVTGGFDPLHSGHISYIRSAKQLGDRLFVGINSDEWLARKKGQSFMPLDERRQIIGSLKDVDATVTFDDTDGSAIKLLEDIKKSYPYAKIIFANGGDRTKENIPEMVVKDVEFCFGVGGNEKLNSSSIILDHWKNQKTIRPWGWYRVLDDKVTHKVKELTIDPGKSLSFQKHNYRNEFWYILKGNCKIKTNFNNITNVVEKTENETYNIAKGVWHQAYNNSDAPCYILEIQTGTSCVETDIERKDA